MDCWDGGDGKNSESGVISDHSDEQDILTITGISTLRKMGMHT